MSIFTFLTIRGTSSSAIPINCWPGPTSFAVASITLFSFDALIWIRLLTRLALLQGCSWFLCILAFCFTSYWLMLAYFCTTCNHLHLILASCTWSSFPSFSHLFTQSFAGSQTHNNRIRARDKSMKILFLLQIETFGKNQKFLFIIFPTLLLVFYLPRNTLPDSAKTIPSPEY